MKPEVFRLSGTLRWLITALLGTFIGITLTALFGLIEASKGVPMSWATRIQIPAFAGIPCAIGILGAWRSRIVTDGTGLRWRGLGREKAATWDQVEDYFITFSRFGQSASRIYMVRFRDGRKLSLDSSLEEFRRLQKIISERATNAKTKGWLIFGQEGNVSGTIAGFYNEKKRRILHWFHFVPSVMFIGIGVGCSFLPIENRSRIGTIPMLATICLPAILGFGWMAIKAFQKEKKHLHERIEADEKGFTFHSSKGDSTSVAWNEVSLVRSKMEGWLSYWSIQASDDKFHLLETMENASILAAMARQYAPQAYLMTSPASARDALAPTEKTDGKRTFHFRTRSNRSLLATIFLCGAVVLVVLGYCHQQNILSSEGPSLPTRQLSVMATLIFAGWAWGLWRYKSARLVLDGEGVTQYGLRGVQRVGYEEIARLGISEMFFLETHDGRRPIKWFLNIADAHELRLELEKRTGLRFLSAEVIEQVEEPAKQPDDVQQKLEGGHTGR